MDEQLEPWQRRGSSSPPSRADLRVAARAVRDSALRRQVLDTVRPAGVSGVLRSHAPLALLLRLADREQRLIWKSPECYAVLEPPIEHRRRASSGTRKLRLLDAYWDVLIFTAPPFVLLAVAAGLGWAAPRAANAALVLVIAALAITFLGLLAVVVLQAYRLLSGRRRLAETAVGQARVAHWTMVLGHVREPEQVGGLFEAARQWGKTSGKRRTHPVLCLESGLTSHAARTAARSDPRIHQLSDRPAVLVYADPQDPPLAIPDGPGRFLGRDLVTVLGGSGLALLMLAGLVPQGELPYCVAPSECRGQPATYGDALYWLVSRVLGGDPEGMGALSPANRVIGLLLTFYGVVVLVGIVDRVIQQQIDDSVASGPSLIREFNQRQEQRALELASTLPTVQPTRSRGLVTILKDLTRGLRN